MFGFLLILLISLLLIYVQIVFNDIFSYWKIRGVDVSNYHYFFGNVFEAFSLRKNLAVIIDDSYRKFSGYNYFGFYNYTNRAIVVKNPELIKKILVTDFDSFCDNAFDIDIKADPIMGRHPFTSNGDDWKASRMQINPVFTSAKVKLMLPFILQNADLWLDHIANHKNQALEAKNLSYYFAAENVAKCIFGVEGRSYENENAHFLTFGQQIFNPSSKNFFKLFCIFLFPALSKHFNACMFQEEVVNFLRITVREIIKLKKSNQFIGSSRSDVLGMFLNLEQRINDSDKFNFHHIVSHVGGFFADSIESSAATISHALYEIAKHQNIQEKLREEFKEHLDENDEITYESIKDLHYLDCFFKENLRHHPPVLILTKRVTKPYNLGPILQDSSEGIQDLYLEEGTNIIIPRYSIHMDDQYFPEAKTFNPDRFSNTSGQKIKKFTYLPFGEGPRKCPGIALGVIQVKIAVIKILLKFRVLLDKRTPNVMQIDPKSFVNRPLNGYWLKFESL